MYQIELSPRKATPTQAKNTDSPAYIHIVVSLIASLNLRTRVFNIGVLSLSFTATWYLSTLSSLLFVNHNNNMCCMMFQLSYCFWFDIYIYIYIFFFSFCDLWFEVWKMEAWVLVGISIYCFGFILL